MRFTESVLPRTRMLQRPVSFHFRQAGACRVVVLSITLLLAWSSSGYAQEESVHDHPEPVVLAPGYSPLEFTPPEAGSYLLPPIGRAADGSVIDSHGRKHRMHDLIGDKITVLSFIYTSCNDVNGCPLATFVLKGVQEKVLADENLTDNVRIVSLSFDPDRDTPEVLEAYGGYFKEHGFDWRFLTTSSTDELDPLLAAYDQSVIRDYDQDGNFLGTLSHILRVLLIDRDRNIRNIYSTSFLHADTVANDIRTLLDADH